MISFLRRHQKSIFVATITVFLLGTFVGLGGYFFTSRDMDGTIARVGSVKIPSQRFYVRVNQYADAMRAKGADLDDAQMARLRREMVNDMMVEEMLAMKADELGLVVTDEELARDIRATPAFQRGGQFAQDAYFQAVRQIFRESPQDYEVQRRKTIKTTRLKQFLFRAAKVSPDEVREAYAREKKGSMKDFEKEKAAFAMRLQQQRAVDLINYCLRQLSTQVEHQVFLDRVDSGA